MTESTAEKCATPDVARIGIHLVYSRNRSNQQRRETPPSADSITAPQEASPGRFSSALICVTAALTVPAVWACHSILHSLALL